MTLADERMAFVLGLIAGEGSFYITFAYDDRRRYDVAYGARFVMNMGVFAESLLRHVHDIVDMGRVREGGSGYVWIVSSREETHALRDLIDEYLQQHDSPFVSASKYRSYCLWSEALDLLSPGHSLSEAEIRELATLKGRMNRIPDSGRSPEKLHSIIDEAIDR